ncbi:TetR family transcriptional regulator [Nocardia sp. NPDC051787]|uniref:TetR family transcriptional regulator n=1 Tax=Nocardia sp. NPDC051787 TaxID=3155415 RepID=UPI0034370788
MSPASAPTEATRDRIVAAAKNEFARHGIAGARVDRIAREAKTSKERVYAYFRSKENLYGFVAGEELAAVAEATRMDPTDLPGYAGRVHDYFATHPDNYRLMMWGQLELADAAPEPDDPVQETVRRKVTQLRQAQQAGQLDPSWDPLDILVFLNQLAASWAIPPSPIDSLQRETFLADRRAAIVAAVQRLFPAATQPPTQK